MVAVKTVGVMALKPKEKTTPTVRLRGGGSEEAQTRKMVVESMGVKSNYFGEAPVVNPKL